MTIIATDSARYSQVVKGEFWPEKGWGKEVVTTAIANFTVVRKALGVGNWLVMSAAPAAGDSVGIVLMATEEDSAKKFVMTKGPARVAKQSLITYGGITAPDLATVIARLESINIQVDEQI